MPTDQPKSTDLPMQPAAHRGKWANRLGILLILALFAGVIVARNNLRAWWWAWRLTQAENREDSAYYIASLMAVGDDAVSPVRWLANRPKPEVRSATILILNRLPLAESAPIFEELISDEDIDIRESAALTLAFQNDANAVSQLIRIAKSDEIGAAAATAALGRVDSSGAREALVHILQRQRDAAVRAQAVEAMADLLVAGIPEDAKFFAPSATDTPDATHSPAGELLLVMMDATNDSGEFQGALSTERQVAAVAGEVPGVGVFDEASPTSAPAAGERRTVGQVAKAQLQRVLGSRPIPNPDTPDRAALADTLLKRWRERLAAPSP